jgi:hypothetical protein
VTRLRVVATSSAPWITGATSASCPVQAEFETATPVLVSPEKTLRIKPTELIDLAPRLAQ